MRAVGAAHGDTIRQWEFLRDAILRTYGPRRGPLIICALTRDDPAKACQGRRLAIVIDSSGSNTETDPQNLRIAAGRSFNSRLLTEADLGGPGRGSDLSTVIDFDTSARVVSPLADPSRASFAGIDSDGGTNIASGINAAIAELTRDGALQAGRAGMIVLTDGQDSSVSDQIAALGRARTLGIRVSYGFLQPPSNPVSRRAALARSTRTLGGRWSVRTPAAAAHAAQANKPSADLVAAILATGGFFATLDSAEAQAQFVTDAESRGVTAIDDPRAGEGGGTLSEGVAATDQVAKDATQRWTRAVPAGRALQVVVKPLGSGTLSVREVDTSTGQVMGEGTSQSGAPVEMTGTTIGPIDLEVSVTTSDATPVLYEISSVTSGVDVPGTARADRIVCTAQTLSYVTAGNGNDRVTCGPYNDVIVGGKGADRLDGGAGNDIFVAGRADLKSGTERINGGDGIDTAIFSFNRPRGLSCSRAKRSVRLSRRAVFSMRGIERVRFNDKLCG